MNEELTNDVLSFSDTDSVSDIINNDLVNEEKSVVNTDVRKRIDDLLEQKRLKELLDDVDDWDF